MKNTKKIFVTSLILILSAVIAFWLMAHIFASYPNLGHYQVRDSDSLLFARLLEQSILRNEVILHDNYGCFPYQMELSFAPLHLRLLYYLSAITYQLFPDLNMSPLEILGALPIIVVWSTALMICIATWLLSGNMVLLLFVGTGLLPGFSAAMTGRYMQIDYDFLNSFYIWVFLLACALHIKREHSVWLLAGALATTCFVATWTGTPLFYFFVTLYGFKLWLFDDQEAVKYNQYVSSAMLIGGIVNLILVVREGVSTFSMANYSLFQPVCLIAGGVFCQLIFSYGGRITKRAGVVALIFGMIFMTAVFKEQVLASSGLLLQKDPIHQSISELKSAIRVRKMAVSSSFAEDLTVYYGWTIFLLPIFVFFPPVIAVDKGGRVIRDWLAAMIILSIYQSRFVRWPGIGIGLYTGMAFFILWSAMKNYVRKAGKNSRRWLMPAAFLPLLLLQNMQDFSVSSAGSGLDRDLVEAINWISANTPETSGYKDANTPEYSILPFWDEGNLLAFYCKRPVAVNNAMWGFKTMADVFSAETEIEASSYCSEYGIRYVFIDNSRVFNDPSIAYWQHMKKMPKSAAYDFQCGEIEYAKKFDHWFYFWLRDDWAVNKRGSFAASNHFRLAYISRAEDAVMPKNLFYEHVNGAKLEVIADPASSVQLSLVVAAGNKKLLYKKTVIADDKGLASFCLAYATSHRGGRITTEPFYKLSLFIGGKKQRAMLKVDDSAVLTGKRLEMGDLEMVAKE